MFMGNKTYQNYMSDADIIEVYKKDRKAGNEKMIEKNLLLWGKAYPFDLNSLKKLQIPFMLLGPWGKDLHERTERVNIESVSKKLPAVLDAILSYVGKIDS